MKLMIVLGTRPEIIRLANIIGRLDELCELTVVHTGQNYDRNLSDVFFEQLGVRRPDRHLEARGSFGPQVGTMLAECERIFTENRPDRFLVLGDTNSGVTAFLAKRMGIPVFHMEAGNRCFDDRVPEEVNRRVIDHSSDILMPYTERSRANLLREGIESNRVYVTGNPIYEIIETYRDSIDSSGILAELDLCVRDYFLVTMHRAENVDRIDRLSQLMAGLERLAADFGKPVVVSTHPRTRQRMDEHGIAPASDSIRFLPPFPFFDFVNLELNAFCVISDSGTVQEECCIYKIPNVTIRDVTERPETVECGSNVLAGSDPDRLLRCVSAVTSGSRDWTPPPEYLKPDVTSIVVNILMGHYHLHNFPNE